MAGLLPYRHIRRRTAGALGRRHPYPPRPADNLEMLRRGSGMAHRSCKVQPLVLRRRLLGFPQEATGELADKVRGTHIYGEAHRIQAHRAVPGAGGQLGLLHERYPRRRPTDKRAEPVRLYRRSYAGMRCGGSLRVPRGRGKGHG